MTSVQHDPGVLRRLEEVAPEEIGNAMLALLDAAQDLDEEASSA